MICSTHVFTLSIFTLMGSTVYCMQGQQVRTKMSESPNHNQIMQNLQDALFSHYKELKKNGLTTEIIASLNNDTQQGKIIEFKKMKEELATQNPHLEQQLLKIVGEQKLKSITTDFYSISTRTFNETNTVFIRNNTPAQVILLLTAENNFFMSKAAELAQNEILTKYGSPQK